jgi:hypothetical protein
MLGNSADSHSALCDRFVEDIIAVTECLMVADRVDIEAYSHPDAQPSLNDKITRANEGKTGHYGHASKDKLHHLKHALSKHKDSEGVFKRGSC